jgi:dolichyl-phosphate-mannose--protein O-mannosyl transferase
MSALVSRLNRPLSAVLLVTALAAVLRFMHLGHPGELVFDEVYYPKAGCILIGGSDEYCRVDSNDEKFWREDKWDVGSWVHPPLGKWQIGLGIKAFGMDPFGWRFSTALAGTLTVTATALIAQLLFRRPVWTYVAGGLLATEGLSIVMSRTAILDAHLTFWVVAGFLFLLLDRRWIERRQAAADAAFQVAPDPRDVMAQAFAVPGAPPIAGASAEAIDTPLAAGGARVVSPLWRPWRFASGIALGAATSVKWSGAMAIATAVLLSYLWETTRRHRGRITRRAAFGRAFVRETFGLVLAFLVVPLAVYVAIWLPWIHHFGWDWGKWWDTQAGTWRYHFREGLTWTKLDPDTGSATPTHPYYARPWEWVVPPGRPTSFFVRDLGPDIQQILALGSPAIFWANLFAIPYTLFSWWRTRDWRAGFVAVGFLGLFLPWLLVSRPTFYFYAVVLVPFMVLAVTYLLRGLADARLVVRDRSTGEVAVDPDTGQPAISTRFVYRPFVWVYLIVAAVMFVWFWPLMTGGQVTDIHWRAIVWFNRWI